MMDLRSRLRSATVAAAGVIAVVMFISLLAMPNTASATPIINIEKLTNGVDADDAADAPWIAPGDLVTWTFIVENAGDENLFDVEFTDALLGIFEPVGDLAPGDSFTMETSDTALDLGGGVFENVATVVAADGAGNLIEDQDPSHYSNPPSAVPEPATLLLMGIGLAGLGFARRRRLNA